MEAAAPNTAPPEPPDERGLSVVIGSTCTDSDADGCTLVAVWREPTVPAAASDGSRARLGRSRCCCGPSAPDGSGAARDGSGACGSGDACAAAGLGMRNLSIGESVCTKWRAATLTHPLKEALPYSTSTARYSWEYSSSTSHSKFGPSCAARSSESWAPTKAAAKLTARSTR
jgi:hypothetical protein